jgi:hypothetical protein
MILAYLRCRRHHRRWARLDIEETETRIGEQKNFFVATEAEALILVTLP